ncbi:cytidylate kinase-like family protein [Lachnospiraceae bacterium]|nr:cytidylate kinase-like family protein [Lachnospiraceae bacterium]
MYNIITIERQYASGGNEIGKKLAEELGYELYDRNLLSMAAKELKIPSMYIEGLEETHAGGFLFNLSKTPLGGNAGGKDQPVSEKLFQAQKRIIEEAADKGGCVIVGRAAGYILKDRENCLNVFIHCNKQKRVERAIHREGIKEAEAEEALKKNDKRRSGFYNAVTKWEWGHPAFFGLCLDSGALGIDLCVKTLACIAQG